MMWTRAALICQTLFIVSEAWEVSPDCWLGNEEFSVDLLCPHYTGTGKIFCCGDQHTRFCCTQEDYEREKKAAMVDKEKLKKKSHHHHTLKPADKELTSVNKENVVFKKRFKYEDEEVVSDLKLKVIVADLDTEAHDDHEDCLDLEHVDQDPQSRYVDGIGSLKRDGDDLYDNWHFAFNSIILTIAILIMILIIVLIVYTCKSFIIDPRDRDPERPQLVKDHYKQVYNYLRFFLFFVKIL